MINNIIKDVSTKQYFLVSELLNGRKTAVNFDGSLSPMSGIIVCPDTGAKLDFVELLLGRRTVVHDEDVNKYDLHPLSGMIKSTDGQMVNFVELMLNVSGGGSSSGSARASAKDIIRLADISSVVVNRTSANFLITLVTPEKGYYFTLDEVEIFDFDRDIISFNGRIAMNENENKYAQLNCRHGESSINLNAGDIRIFTFKDLETNIIEKESIGELL